MYATGGGIKMMILQSQKVSHEFIWSEQGTLKTGKSVQTHLPDSARRRGVKVFNVTVSPACVFYCYPTEKKVAQPQTRTQTPRDTAN